jgi:hypothetical protein
LDALIVAIRVEAALWFPDHTFISSYMISGTLTLPRRYLLLSQTQHGLLEFGSLHALMGHFVIQCCVVLILCSSNTCRPHHWRALTERVALE